METEFESNEIIDRLPGHLKQFIKPQNYEDYTAINQAVWRYVMRKNVEYLSKVAHSSYLEGLKQTGISIDHIPNMYGMNRILKEIGWAAVAVDGFIPPAAFMEFQAFNVLVIASDIRQLEHIEYTPAPDIIHEGAGHAPIIANPEYAEYLRRFGEIGCKAISSAKDYEIYEAIRHLSIIKEAEDTSEEEIAAAEKRVDQLQNDVREQSEMAQIRNLHWWTVEYGLIGTPEDPKIYGAGLLSSIGESAWCMTDKVKKLPYSIEAANQEFDITKPQPQLYVTPDFAHLSLVLEEFANKMALRVGGLLSSIGESAWCMTDKVKKLPYSIEAANQEFDITKPQPQLFVTPDFAHLSLVLEEFANKMALRVGGLEGLNKLINSKNIGTVELSTGIQISGNFTKVIEHNGQPVYFQTTGETALAHREKELVGHGTKNHPDGFGSPVGKLKGINLAIEDMSPRDLRAYDIYEGETIQLEFEGGVTVSGEIITGTRNLQGKVILISLKNCTVTYREEILFQPDWGQYDMAIGKEVISAFAGPADAKSFNLITHTTSSSTIKSRKTPEKQELESLYKAVRNIREGKSTKFSLEAAFEILQKYHPKDWLLSVEIYELVYEQDEKFAQQVKKHLEEVKSRRPEVAHLVDGGLSLTESKMQ